MKKKAFTIIELLVAMALLAMMVAISSMVFSAAVKAYRTANATTEIMARMRNLTEQLDMDLRGLRKEGEFILVWAPSPKLRRDGFILDDNSDAIPDQYISFDRLFFFADVDAQTFTEQTLNIPPGGSKRISSNLARVCYSFGRDAANIRAGQEPLGEKRLFCRTQHLFTGDADMPLFPDMSVAWDAADFENKNFSLLRPPTPWPFEYQTMTQEKWLELSRIQDQPLENLSNQQKQDLQVKLEMLSSILDLTVDCEVWDSTFSNSQTFTSTVTQGGPMVDLTQMTGVHNLFSQGVGQFHVQVWSNFLKRWYPEIDRNGDGVYNDSDYRKDSSNNNLLDTVKYSGFWIRYENWFSEISALKFTFTIYDSKGIIPDGKTFTHIVYLK